MIEATNSLKNLPKRERRGLITAFIVVPFLYPFLLFWFAQAQLDQVYFNARNLPALYRGIAVPDSGCPENLDRFRDTVRRAIAASVGALPDGSKDTLKSLNILQEFDYLPLFNRGIKLWKRIDVSYYAMLAIWENPETECHRSGENLHEAAADLEVAIERYERTRVMMKVLLYIGLIAEVFAWIIVLRFARRYFGGKAAA